MRANFVILGRVESRAEGCLHVRHQTDGLSRNMSIGSPVRTMRVMGTILPMVAGVLLTCLAARAQLSAGTPTYYRDVLPILQKHCEVCHRAGGIGPISLAHYEMARRYSEAICRVTENKY